MVELHYLLGREMCGHQSLHYVTLEDTVRYAGLLLAPEEGFIQGFFCPSAKQKAYYAVLAHSRPVMVSSRTLIISSSNIRNLERNP